tara:strand:- start:314 stop:622 length:309 start_codon:yes stop_codon:yes gene_type:complete
MIDQMIRVTNDKNITFSVVLSKDKKEQNLVSFYDTRYNHTQYGQFIGRYCASTLLGLDGYGSGIKDRGLDLHGGIADWFINADNANHVVDFIDMIKEEEVTE